ncbi:MAG: SDR family oxidoreductase [Deltaproteobacteria bacterium]|nr:SDR family oxidoreductase [Deltaproteobacteria bacterium]
MLDFEGQNVIVTGGTRGIGAAISAAFLGRGAHVVATYRGDQSAAQAFLASRSVAEQARLRLAEFEVQDAAAVEAFFGDLEAPPQVVVNNAGIRKDAIVGMMSHDDWRKVLAVNLEGTFLVSKMAVKAMSRQRYGRIVNIVSPSAWMGFTGQANYAASKAGQIAMAKVLSKEVATRNITVNCIAPGFVDTDLLKDLLEDDKKRFVSMVPLGRFARAEEIAHAVLFVASKEASYVTGTTLEVTGGI